MKHKTYYIVTFGCQMNISDSENISGLLESLNFKKAENEDSADILIYNTCSIRETAEDRIFGLNKKIKNLKLKNLNLKIILTGCITHYKEEELKRRLPYIDNVVKIKDFEKIKNLAESLNTENSNQINLNPFIPKYKSFFRASVSISTGCDNFCSYCIVPYSRGRENSRPTDNILKEVEYLAKNNYKEIWLLGQNVNSYNFKKNNFAKLLKTINKIPGDFWIRFTSPHPKNFSDDLINEMASREKFPRYLNLPAQSGDNEILKKMNRNYTREEYIKLAEKIKIAMPGIALSTDVIVGFPGETKKQFQNTASLFKKIKFDMAYISEYSERPKTLAAKKFKDDIPKKEKKERKKILTEILSETALILNKKLIGREIKVLADEEKKGRLFGRTEGNKPIEIEGGNYNLIGSFITVKIVSATPWKLKGELKN